MDIEPSCIALGGWQLGGHRWGKVSETEMIKAIHKALDSGINFFDTAPIYGLGHSEEVLGKALGAERKNLIIGTKVGLVWKKNNKTFEKFTDCSPANIKREIDMSLKMLNMDYIDIYQIHWPDPKTSIEDTLFAMDELKEQGKNPFILDSKEIVISLLSNHLFVTFLKFADKASTFNWKRELRKS